MKIDFSIKEYREFLKIDQKYMSEMLGISQAAYSKIESFVNITTKERYEKIAKILDLDLEHIKNNKVELIFIVCRSNSNCSENEQKLINKALDIIEYNIQTVKKIYNNS